MKSRSLLLLFCVAALFAQVKYTFQPGDAILRGGWVFDSVHDGGSRQRAESGFIHNVRSAGADW